MLRALRWGFEILAILVAAPSTTGRSQQVEETGTSQAVKHRDMRHTTKTSQEEPTLITHSPCNGHPIPTSIPYVYVIYKENAEI